MGLIFMAALFTVTASNLKSGGFREKNNKIFDATSLEVNEDDEKRITDLAKEAFLEAEAEALEAKLKGGPSVENGIHCDAALFACNRACDRSPDCLPCSFWGCGPVCNFCKQQCRNVYDLCEDNL